MTQFSCIKKSLGIQNFSSAFLPNTQYFLGIFLEIWIYIADKTNDLLKIWKSTFQDSLDSLQKNKIKHATHCQFADR